MRDEPKEAMCRRLGNLVNVLKPRNVHALSEDLFFSFSLYLHENVYKHRHGVSLVLKSTIMILYFSCLSRTTGRHSSVLKAWPIVQVLAKTSRTD